MASGRKSKRKGSRAQTEWARIVGGRNVGVLGGEDCEGPDGMLWEVKSVAKPSPGLILSALNQAATAAAKHHKPYGVALRLDNKPIEERWLVIVPGKVWSELHGR